MCDRRSFADLSDESLLELQERLYDEMIKGDVVAAEMHDDVVQEIQYRAEGGG